MSDVFRWSVAAGFVSYPARLVCVGPHLSTCVVLVVAQKSCSLIALRRSRANLLRRTRVQGEILPAMLLLAVARLQPKPSEIVVETDNLCRSTFFNLCCLGGCPEILQLNRSASGEAERIYCEGHLSKAVMFIVKCSASCVPPGLLTRLMLRWTFFCYMSGDYGAVGF